MKFKKGILTITSFLFFALLIFIIQPKINSFLSPNIPCPANILVVEGWLSDSALNQVSKEFKQKDYNYLITTGEPLPEAFGLYQNGKLNFSIPNNINFNPKVQHKLIIKAWGSKAGDSYAKMKILINDKEIKTIEVNRRKKEYALKLQLKNNPDTISLCFINNAHIGKDDRNLFVDYIRIDSVTIPAKSNLTHYTIQIGPNTITKRTNIKSFANKAALQLMSLGIDSNRIISLPTPYVRWYRTFTSAVVVSEWLKKNDIPVKGINVCSQGDHSRRTWLLYRKALKNNHNIGIISIPKPNYLKQNRLSLKFGILNDWRELFGYLYMRYLFNDRKQYNKIRSMLNERKDND